MRLNSCSYLKCMLYPVQLIPTRPLRRGTSLFYKRAFVYHITLSLLSSALAVWRISNGKYGLCNRLWFAMNGDDSSSLGDGLKWWWLYLLMYYDSLFWSIAHVSWMAISTIDTFAVKAKSVAKYLIKSHNHALDSVSVLRFSCASGVLLVQIARSFNKLTAFRYVLFKTKWYFCGLTYYIFDNALSVVSNKSFLLSSTPVDAVIIEYLARKLHDVCIFARAGPITSIVFI